MRELAAGEAVLAESVVRGSPASPDTTADQAARETIESVVVAVVLAFLFRAFVAEAFVIPTGSMAPTLQGRHMDVVCPQCGHQYRTGASVENDEQGPPRGEVTRTRCPLCRYAMTLDKEHQANHKSFNGDRILVSKFAHQLREPQRWDVIVFKYPGEAKINYIKRLIGLPGETIRIRHGDIHTLDPDTAEQPEGRQVFRIARKPPNKVVAMLQLVDDTYYVPQHVRDGLWPVRWSAIQVANSAAWRRSEDHRNFGIEAGSTRAWLRYHHLVPRADDWVRIAKRLPYQRAGYRGQLVTDYYAYNDSFHSESGRECWVGDLAVEGDVEVESSGGEVTLELVEGGTHFRCNIDVSTGIATLNIDGGQRASKPSFGDPSPQTATTEVHGAGNYSLRFANVDDQLFLWVNNQVVEFDKGGKYEPSPNVVPRWSTNDPGDLAPVALGARNITLQVNRLRVLRDVYYRAVEPVDPYWNSEYDKSAVGYEFDVAALMAHPQDWKTTPLFNARRSVTFHLDADQFFPLGDNSPESRDARVWSERQYATNTLSPPPYVSRELLIGKALLIYWPHSWRLGSDWLPIVPNFQRIGAIR